MLPLMLENVISEYSQNLQTVQFIMFIFLWTVEKHKRMFNCIFCKHYGNVTFEFSPNHLKHEKLMNIQLKCSEKRPVNDVETMLGSIVTCNRITSFKYKINVTVICYSNTCIIKLQLLMKILQLLMKMLKITKDVLLIFSHTHTDLIDFFPKLN